MISAPHSDVLDSALDPFTECLTPEVARRLLDMHANAPTQARIDELSDKANEGNLSPEESGEYDKYLSVYHFISILQAKARRFLHWNSSATA